MLGALRIAPTMNGGKFLRYGLFGVVMFYLFFHALSGELGLYEWVQESRRAELLEVELETLKTDREALERKVKLMRPDSLDRDLLDQQSRELLGLIGDGEVVYFPEPPAKENAR